MIWLHVTSGRGKVECHLGVKLLTEAIQCEAADGQLTASIIDFAATDHGFASVLLVVEGTGEYDFCKSLTGSVEWIWKSTIRPHWPRKRWFLGVDAFVPPDMLSTELTESDLRWESMKSSGPGGQHVNKTESAIRLTHLPTGVVVTAQEERSQFRNKSLAKARLARKLLERQQTQVSDQQKALQFNHDNLVRGNAIRTYEGLEFNRKMK
jgi:peptide chain release factor